MSWNNVRPSVLWTWPTETVKKYYYGNQSEETSTSTSTSTTNDETSPLLPDTRPQVSRPIPIPMAELRESVRKSSLEWKPIEANEPIEDYKPMAEEVVLVTEEEEPLNEQAMEYLHREIEGVRSLLSDFSLLVSAQTPLFEDIEDHIDESSNLVDDGQKQIKKAQRHQKKRKKWLWGLIAGLSTTAVGLGLGLGLGLKK